MDGIVEALFRERTEGTVPLAIRITTGVFFVAVSFAKFIDHAVETEEFEEYGVPVAGTAVIVVGIVELVGGLALVLGLLTRVAAFALAANMVGAVATAGRVEGGAFHLGVAPTVFVLMLVLLWAGPGRMSLDRVLARRLERG